MHPGQALHNIDENTLDLFPDQGQQERHKSQQRAKKSYIKVRASLLIKGGSLETHVRIRDHGRGIQVKEYTRRLRSLETCFRIRDNRGCIKVKSMLRKITLRSR